MAVPLRAVRRRPSCSRSPPPPTAVSGSTRVRQQTATCGAPDPYAVCISQVPVQALSSAPTSATTHRPGAWADPAVQEGGADDPEQDRGEPEQDGSGAGQRGSAQGAWQPWRQDRGQHRTGQHRQHDGRQGAGRGEVRVDRPVRGPHEQQGEDDDAGDAEDAPRQLPRSRPVVAAPGAQGDRDGHGEDPDGLHQGDRGERQCRHVQPTGDDPLQAAEQPRGTPHQPPERSGSTRPAVEISRRARAAPPRAGAPRPARRGRPRRPPARARARAGQRSRAAAERSSPRPTPVPGPGGAARWSEVCSTALRWFVREGPRGTP